MARILVGNGLCDGIVGALGKRISAFKPSDRILFDDGLELFPVVDLWPTDFRRYLALYRSFDSFSSIPVDGASNIIIDRRPDQIHCWSGERIGDRS